MPHRVLKVFATARERAALARRFPVIDRFPGFLVLRVPASAAARVRARHLVEDLTPHYRLRVGGKLVDASGPPRRGDGEPRAVRDAARLPPGPHHYLVLFRGPIKREWLAAVRRAGAEPREPHGGFRWIVRADAGAVRRVAALACVRWLAHWPHADRVALRRDERRARHLPGALIVEFLDAADARAAGASLAELGCRVLSAYDATLVVAVPEGTARDGLARRLSRIHGVRHVGRRPLPHAANDVAAQILGAAVVKHPAGLGLSGRGEIVAICDTGLDIGRRRGVHPDFAGRIAGLRSYPIPADYDVDALNCGADDGCADRSGHGTHVAGSAVGSGHASVAAGMPAPVRGLAHGARLFFQAVQQRVRWRSKKAARDNGDYPLAGIPADWTPVLQEAYDAGARVHSDSWNDDEPGAYDAQARQLDAFVWRHPDMCVVVSAGNDGEDRDRDGAIAPGSVTSLATAKNCIAVGACESRRPEFGDRTYHGLFGRDFPVAPFRDDPVADDPGQVVAFSSRGPTLDGRFKPDVVAPGTYILSARTSALARGEDDSWAACPACRRYWYMGGTSMAAPQVAGVAALVREHLRRHARVPRPSAALVKATLVAGAVRLRCGPAGAVVDHDQGFGRVSLDAVLAPPYPARARFVDVRRGLHTGDLHRLSLTVTSARAPLRVALAYADYPGHELCNNLNLVVRGPGGEVVTGNQPVGGRPVLDASNNVEVAHVAAPAPGAWAVEVIGANVPQGPQPFALVLLGPI